MFLGSGNTILVLLPWFKVKLTLIGSVQIICFYDHNYSPLYILKLYRYKMPTYPKMFSFPMAITSKKCNLKFLFFTEIWKGVVAVIWEGGSIPTHLFLKIMFLSCIFFLITQLFKTYKSKKKVTLNLSSFQRYREDSFREKLKQPTWQDVAAEHLTVFKKKTAIARELLFFFTFSFFHKLQSIKKATC